MLAFRLLLIAMFVGVMLYTGVAIANDGWNLLPYFIGDVLKMGWPGQFDVDFLCMLILSGLWTAWRNRFSGIGIVLGLLALNLGTPFLSVYLLILIAQTKGNMREVLLGKERAHAPA